MRAILEIILLVLDLYVWLLIASAILSWLVAFNVVNTRNPLVAGIAEFLYRITEPLLAPIRRILPNLGGSLPNDIFADDLGLPTVWVPHSYASCSQHAPNEHMLAPVAREALRVMAGVYWDLGEAGAPRRG